MKERGKFTNAYGSTYVGDFVINKINKNGKHIYADGDTIEKLRKWDKAKKRKFKYKYKIILQIIIKSKY